MSDILYPMDTKESVLKFIYFTPFREAHNPATYIHRHYMKRAKSSIPFGDFTRILDQLADENMLDKITGRDGAWEYKLKLTPDEAAAIWKDKNLTSEKLLLDVLYLRNMVFDYEATKTRAKMAQRLTIVGLGISALALLLSLLQWKCSTPG